MATVQKITPHLWFDHQAEEAAIFYTSVFKNSKIGKISRYGKEGFEVHGRPEGSVMTVAFTLEGQQFLALNGGPIFTFNESISFVVHCDTQEEIDHYWNRLSAGGDPKAQVCGWLKDPFGLSWQVVPSQLEQFLSDPAGAQRVMKALMQMKKLDLAALQQAFEGKETQRA
jgi:predicted 3-demethylubiquinone-9 3-methyltransferase (glyoxalase superfamily)